MKIGIPPEVRVEEIKESFASRKKTVPKASFRAPAPPPTTR